MDVETTCLNRDLPGKLHKPRMILSEGGPISNIACLSGPTPTRRPPRRRSAVWRLISHLSLNHLSLTDAVAGSTSIQDSMVAAGKKISPAADALREILKLYDFADSEKTKAEIESVVNVFSRRVVGRTGGDVSGGFCRGVEVNVTFDEGKFPDHGVFLFATVIERFLALYTSINSFTQFVATTRQREGILKRWTPRAGEKTLL
jgi:type VI secretion system protein ImpG